MALTWSTALYMNLAENTTLQEATLEEASLELHLLQTRWVEAALVQEEATLQEASLQVEVAMLLAGRAEDAALKLNQPPSGEEPALIVSRQVHGGHRLELFPFFFLHLLSAPLKPLIPQCLL